MEDALRRAIGVVRGRLQWLGDVEARGVVEVGEVS